ncbi:hypothetical protein CPB84DRAFT_1793768 [Gymnopilus junonius]|uniref:Uncharacterized protein n=1 Tax=Gymnopilus junonius TaxID=109634 RepID=A0A9P5NEF1_GYMJU|nr:hypothetical protein CPB84DRAFT_1793768 [Gymnopilus junonius]
MLHNISVPFFPKFLTCIKGSLTLHIKITMTAVATAHSDLDQFLTNFDSKGGISKEQEKAVKTSVNEQIKDGDLRQKANEELKRMGESVRVDDKKVILDEHKNVKLYAPEWIDIHNTYTDLMHESQGTANKLKNKMNYLVDVLLPISENVNFETAKKAKAIDKYILDLTQFADNGDKHATGFLRIRQRVGSFRDKLTNEVKQQQVDVQNELNNVISKIEALEKELNATLKLAGPNLAKTGGATIAAAGTAGTIIATAGLAALAPVAGIGILAAGLAGLGFSTFSANKERLAKEAAKKEELSGLIRQRDELLARKENLEEVLKELNKLGTVFDDLITRLSAMESIWRMLITDAGSLRDSLQYLDSADEAFIFEMTADSAKAVYKTLASALDTYTLAVAPIKK